MTNEQWAAIIIVAIPALGSVIVGVLNRRKLDEIHVMVNSRLSELVSASGRAEHAEGLVQGSSDSALIRELIHDAIAKALAAPPPSGLSEMQATGQDTNERVREVQADAETAARLAAAVADALALKESTSAALHKQGPSGL